MSTRQLLLLLAGLGLLFALSLCGHHATVRAAGEDARIRTWYLSSYQQEQSKNYAAAITSLTDVPDSYLLELRLGWLYYLKGSYSSAITHYQAAIKREPDSIEARLGYLLPLLALGKHQDVHTVARFVLAIDGENYLANLRLAYSLRMNMKNDQALDILGRMAKRYPTDTSVLIEQALNYTAMNQRETALPLYNQVLLLDQSNTIAKPYADNTGVTQRKCYYSSYSSEQTRDYATALTAIANLPKGYLVELRRGWLCYLKGDYVEAVAHYRTSIELSPDSLEAKNGCLLPMLAAQDYPAAVTLAESVLASDKYNYLANLRLAVALRLHKDTARASAIVNHMVQLYPTDVSLLTEQGQDAQLNGKHDTALQIFNQILLLDPTNATAKTQLGN